ncbi:MAG: HAD family hydrolase, partial [Pseudomonadota bacterium]
MSDDLSRAFGPEIPQTDDMLHQISAILFDKDGTLFDFQATWAAVADQTLQELTSDTALQRRLAMLGGYDPDERRFAGGSPLVAGSLREIAEIWAPLLPDRDVGEIEDLADRIAMEASLAGCLVPSVPDLPGFLAGLRAAGFVLGIATHDSQESAEMQIEAVGASGHFDFIAGYDSGFGLKPGPGMLVAFAHVSGHPPER